VILRFQPERINQMTCLLPLGAGFGISALGMLVSYATRLRQAMSEQDRNHSNPPVARSHRVKQKEK
jgi:hypothetical protein